MRILTYFLSPRKKICLPTSFSPVCSKMEPSNVFFFQRSMSLVLVDKMCLLVPDLVHCIFHSNVCNQLPFIRASMYDTPNIIHKTVGMLIDYGASSCKIMNLDMSSYDVLMPKDPLK
jgi:hypothetical protein